MRVRPGHLLIGPLLVGSALTISLATASSSAAGGPGLLHTTMTGEAEVPGPGDDDGLGWAHVRVSPSRGQVCVSLKVQAIAPATAAHVHKAPPGVAGPPVITLTTPENGSSRGCHTADEALLRDIQDNPGDYYVNVHNGEFPDGAIRGQLQR